MTTPTIRLTVWKGFRAGKRKKPSTGTIEVDFHGDAMTPRMKEAVRATEKRAAAMKPRILEALLEAYPTLEKLPGQRKPKTMTKAALKDNFELWEILVTKDHFQGIAYVAYGFENSWHPSGNRVLTHGDRIVAVGDSDVLGYPHADPLRAPEKTKGPTAAKVKALRAAAEKRAKKNPKELRRDRDELTVHFPTWAGFVRGGGTPSKGDVVVGVGGDDEDLAVGPAQQAAYQHLLRHARTMQEHILDAIAAAYPKLVAKADFDGPKSVDRAALATLVTLNMIHVHRATKDGVAIVGYQLGCAWDPEHGLGVLAHRDAIFEIGSADTAILGWMATKAARKKR